MRFLSKTKCPDEVCDSMFLARGSWLPDVVDYMREMWDISVEVFLSDVPSRRNGRKKYTIRVSDSSSAVSRLSDDDYIGCWIDGVKTAAELFIQSSLEETIETKLS